MTAQFQTIAQMLNFYYGPQMVRKDAPVITTTTGVYNAVFGAQAFSQLNNEANVFAILPKIPWQKSGFRVISADAGSTGDGGVAENASIPATTKPTFAAVTMTVAEVAHAFDVSFRHSGLVKTQDDAIGNMDFLRGYHATRHAKRINEQLCIDGNTLASAGNTFESIDRVTMSTAAATALSWDTDDENLYDIDRGANSWADGYVDHNSGTDRYLTPDMIETSLGTLANRGGRTNIILTGNDTKWRIISLYQNQVRYAGVVNTADSVKIGINGVTTEEGMGVGIRVASVYGIPLIASQAVQADTISRIYLLDTTMNEATGVPRLCIGLLHPTLYFESGMDTANPNPFAIDRFGTEGVYYTAGNLICTFPAVQGSIRDLK